MQQVADINKAIELGFAVDKTLNGKMLPFWRNVYQLLYKPPTSTAPMTKWFYHEQGFSSALTLAKRYCDHFEYRYLAICPVFSDLEFEINGEQSLKIKEKS